MRPVLPAWRVAALVGAVVIAGNFFVPVPARSVTYLGIGLAALVLAGVGIARNRPADRASWLLLVIGNLMFLGGDAVLTWYDLMHREAPFPSIADPIYLSGYPLLFGAMLRLAHRTAGRGSRERWLDAAIVTLGALALSWHFLIGPNNDAPMGLLARLSLGAYPIMDVALIFVVIYGAALGGARRTSDWLIGLSVLVMLGADGGYDLLELHGAYQSGDLIDAGWLVSYLLIGVAALHPSMALATPPVRTDHHRRDWLPMAGVACFVPPALLLGFTMAGLAINVPVMAGISLVLAALITTRIGWLFGRLREHAASLQQALHARELLEADLRHQAFHDDLTGLANRALLLDRIEHALSACDRERHAVTLLVCGLDRFATVNNSLGHLAGDSVLAATASRISAVIRGGDTVARLGGDEFAVLMPHVADAAEGQALAERLLSILHQPIALNGQLITLSASIGVTFATTTPNAEQLLADADSAMYEAKSRGRNRFVVFEAAMRARAVERLAIVTALDGAVDREEFFLELQPHFSLDAGTLQGFEALVRWNHPSLGQVPPSRFIAAAEETGYIVELGRWVLRTACEYAATWPGNLSVAVNVSARQLHHSTLVADVHSALLATGLPARQLVLELTESMVADIDEGAVVLDRLRAIGVRVAIDDFGTGYSSLAALRAFPVDILKIDRSFVEGLRGSDSAGNAFVATIIDLARELGLTTIAEGVELESQWATLAELGCDSAQGFLMSRPLRRDAAHRLALGAVHSEPALAPAGLVRSR